MINFEAMEACSLTTTEYVFTYYIRVKDYDAAKYILQNDNWTKEDLKFLFTKKVLKNIGPPGSYDISKYRVTEKFDKYFDSDDDNSEKFDEFVAAYPRFIYISGKRVAALNADMDELEEEYVKKVVKKGKHEDVMTALNWARENHEIHMGIKLWFSSRQWLSIQEIMNDKSGSRLPSNNLL